MLTVVSTDMPLLSLLQYILNLGEILAITTSH